MEAERARAPPATGPARCDLFHPTPHGSTFGLGLPSQLPVMSHGDSQAQPLPQPHFSGGHTFMRAPQLQLSPAVDSALSFTGIGHGFGYPGALREIHGVHGASTAHDPRQAHGFVPQCYDSAGFPVAASMSQRLYDGFTMHGLTPRAPWDGSPMRQPYFPISGSDGSAMDPNAVLGNIQARMARRRECQVHTGLYIWFL